MLSGVTDYSLELSRIIYIYCLWNISVNVLKYISMLPSGFVNGWAQISFVCHTVFFKV